jgi:hypothetical protein
LFRYQTGVVIAGVLELFIFSRALVLGWKPAKVDADAPPAVEEEPRPIFGYSGG